VENVSRWHIIEVMGNVSRCYIGEVVYYISRWHVGEDEANISRWHVCEFMDNIPGWVRFWQTYRLLNAIVAQSKNCPLGVNITIDLKSIKELHSPVMASSGVFFD
jgi:hypothetical protein